MNDFLIDMLERHEGFRSQMYKCTADKWTIGYGHNLEDKGISKKASRQILRDDIGDAVRDALDVFPTLWTYGEARYSALIDLAFNIGLPSLRSFKKMIAAVNAAAWDTAADELKDSVWYTQVGNRGIELVQLLKTGDINKDTFDIDTHVKHAIPRINCL